MDSPRKACGFPQRTDLRPALRVHSLPTPGAYGWKPLRAFHTAPCRVASAARFIAKIFPTLRNRPRRNSYTTRWDAGGAPRRRLLALLKALPFTVTGHGSWEEAIVTAGGIALADLDPRTLASRRIPGLHFAGEVLDLDANTGGYNLQIACSTGWLAGQSAAEWVQEGSLRRHGEHGEKMEKRNI